MTNMRPLLILLCLFTSATASEVDEVARLAPKYNARQEVRLWDQTRVDLLNDTHAIEVDWAEKHYEAVGQATWYSIVTRKKPGVILLVRDTRKEARHIYRATAICERLGITLWIEKVKPK